MQEISLELSVGDSLMIGNRLLTVLDIDGEEIRFQVEDSAGAEWGFDEDQDLDSERPPR